MSAINYRIKLQRLEDIVRRKHGSGRRLAPNEERILDRHAVEMLRSVRDRWPVDTGTSRSAWTWQTIASPGQYAIVLENPMFYASFVHRRGSPKASGLHGQWLNPAVYETLIPDVWREVSDKLYRDLEREVDITERRLERKAPGFLQIGETVFDVFRPWFEAVL